MVAGASSSSSAAAASAGAEVVYHDVDEELAAEHSRTEGRLAAWRSLVKKLFRIRSWQRIWGVLGGVLRGYPTELRDRVRDTL